jgi:putative ABC transport system permease protein
MSGLAQDVRCALRQLRRNPGFAAVAVLTLALGIGCALTMFSTYEGAILNRPPVRDLDRLANVWIVNYQTGTDRGSLSIPDFLNLRSHMTAFEELAAFASSDRVLSRIGEPRRVETMMVSGNFFHLLGARPKLGRVFTENEGQPGASPVAVISEGLWRRDFGEKADILGQIVRFDGTPYAIIGVMPDSFWYPAQGTEVWMPLALDSPLNRAAGVVKVVGRLRKEVTIEQANAEAAVFARTLAAPSPTSSFGMRVVSYDSEQYKRIGLVLAFGIGPPILVLLIGCSNITNLLMARGLARRMEFATRAALGAGRRRIVQQLLTEYMMLAFAGASAGVLVAYMGVKALQRLFESRISTATAIQLNWHTLVFATASALLIPILFGLSPALRASEANLNEALRQVRTASGARITLKRLPLVVFEIAMAMLLLVVCGLFIRTLLGIERNAPPKIDAAKLVTFTVSVQNGQDWNRLLTDLAALPGVTAVGATSDLPLIVARRSERPLELDDNATEKQTSAIQMDVNAGLFGVFQLPALQGRLPLNREVSVAIVSETFARQYGGNVIGMAVRRGKDSPSALIVGVVRDWLVDAKNGQSLPTVYFPVSKTENTLEVVARAESGTSVISSLTNAVHAWNPDEPVANCKTIAQALNDEFAEPKLVIYVFEVFALLALVLALIGQYGVMHHSTARRIHEMGVRIALGATRRDIFSLVLGEAAILMAVGIALGWLMGIGAGRIVSHELLVTPADPVTALVCASVMLLTGFAATYFPARRAAKVDPMVALRYE